jgi:hypothetical protein
MFQTSQRVKILSMLGFLAVLAMLYVRARDPATWQWLTQDRGSPPTGGGGYRRQPYPATTRYPAAPAAPPDATPKTAAAVTAPEDAAPGPTDEDADQRRDAHEEFQAISDGTVGIQQEEMFAYWRLFTWVQHQSFEAMQKRSQADLVYADFVHDPVKYRGRLVRLELHVRRVLSYPVEDNPAGVERLYEIWGYSDESRGWLYDVVTAELPPGMPVGPSVQAQASFVGYFFKLQGYHEAGAKPHAALLRAPLLVGRLANARPAPEEPSASAAAWVWLAGGGLMILVFAGVMLLTLVQARKAKRRRTVRQQLKSRAVTEWTTQGLADDAWAASPEDCSASGLETRGEFRGAIAADPLSSPNGRGKQSEPERGEPG